MIRSEGDPAVAGGSRLDPLLALVDRGRYDERLERVVLDRVRRGGPSDALVTDWPQLFSALMCARRYPAAFRLGETMLDRLGRLDDPQALMWPWWRKVARAINEAGFLAAEMRSIRSAGRTGAFPHWFAYYRALLCSYVGDLPGARAEYRHVARLPPVRYSWMRQAFVLVELNLLGFERAIAICRGILRHAPGQWWIRCRMAEAHLARGERSRGLREFRRAWRTADARGRREVLVWHGEVLLWLGRYRRALGRFDEAIRLGATTFVYGWRGAARLKRGDLRGALADLDRAIALDEKDMEAYVWRGEAYRLLGRPAEARRDLDHFIAEHPHGAWGFINRGLLRGALGDEKGLGADFARIPSHVREFLHRRLRIPARGTPTPAQQKAMMQAGIDLAKGVRRWETYVDRIWMRLAPTGSPAPAARGTRRPSRARGPGRGSSGRPSRPARRCCAP